MGGMHGGEDWGLRRDGWCRLMKEESVNHTTRSRPLYLHSLIAAPDCVAKPR